MTITASTSGRSTAAGDLDALHAGEVLVVLGRRVGVDDPDLLAERVERERHRQLRADRVAVGPGVGGDQEALPREDLVADLFDRSCGRLGGGPVSSSRSCVRSSPTARREWRLGPFGLEVVG